ncbi:DDE 1 domain containing protein [Asbolus verrucosus]|uniref:DDE 1 domain containing protein n=1 Tax=Asbolus verrucosus TaxID=1661398 RepID=A0A482VCI2_ASBVE|nr:DDE 1 domain containing protein [Asbolus verrucosus]
MLEYGESNNIILLCLPSHTTQALQPLDRSFFKPLKVYYKQEADTFMMTSKDKNINRNVIGKLFGAAWKKAATLINASSGFSATGIYPCNKHVVPDYFFQISDNNENLASVMTASLSQTDQPQTEEQQKQFYSEENFFF